MCFCLEDKAFKMNSLNTEFVWSQRLYRLIINPTMSIMLLTKNRCTIHIYKHNKLIIKGANLSSISFDTDSHFFSSFFMSLLTTEKSVTFDTTASCSFTFSCLIIPSCPLCETRSFWICWNMTIDTHLNLSIHTILHIMDKGQSFHVLLQQVNS